MVRNVSIVIPFYNKYESLYKIHEELKLQLYPDDEALIIDDYSPSGEPKIDCNCTRVIKPPEALIPHVYRLNTLRNLGIKEAKHDAIVVLDPDCLINNHFLESARKLFDPSILVTGRIDKIQKDGTPTVDPRTGNKESGWVDNWEGHGDGGLVWGGCMMFSKARTALVGWFDTAFDGAWGAEEHEFASRCFHSGMRLYYSKELLVTHLYHEKITPNYQDNLNMWHRKAEDNRKNLNIITPYQPAVGVSIISMLRPNLLDQCLRGVFRNNIPVKVRLCINGDNSKETGEALRPWRDKWAVEIVKQERTWPAKIRNDAMKWAKNKGYKYLVFIDDDVTVSANGLVNLVRAINEDDNIYACSGYLRDARNNDIMLGGPLKDNLFHYYARKPVTLDSSWVGGGFTIHRLEPLILYDGDYETGYNDYDWSMEAIKQGKRLAVTGEAGAYHAVKFTEKGVVPYRNPPEYSKIRYDSARFEKMANRFQSKWGFAPRMGPICAT